MKLRWIAKLHLGAYEDAVNLYRRSFGLNRNYATGRFYLCQKSEDWQAIASLATTMGNHTAASALDRGTCL
jgi:hypothetical protein